MKKNNSVRVENSTWQEVQQAINEDLICVIPIGASCKEHGLHLPLNTDFVQAHWFSEQLSLQFRLIFWPVISFGYYPAFLEYPGSWSISENTFMLCVLDIIESTARHGSNQIVLLNTGISTIRPLEAAVSQSPYKDRTTIINVYSGKHVRAMVNDIEEQKKGGHADEFETSIMLAIDHTLVDMRRAQIGLEDINNGPLNLNDPNKPNYCPSGSMGNPTLATVEKGEKILAAILEDLREVIQPMIKL